MFNGNLDNVISYCERIEADFHVNELPNGSRLVYIMEKNPKNKDEYVSYLRVSKHEDNNNFYTRQDGLVGYRTDEWIKDEIDYLTFVNERA